jgi:hypothetical protein
MFRIEMLPAAHGDCLWIEYGTGRTVHRILIDGGPAHTYPALRERVLHLPIQERRFELLVISHIDGDHIDGIARLLQDAEALGCQFGRIWFNGRDQLNRVPDPAGEPLGSSEGEYLSLLIRDYQAGRGKPVWNLEFPDEVVTINRKAQTLPIADLDGECRITLLSPDYGCLLKLKDHWDAELAKAGLKAGDEKALRTSLETNRRLRPLGDVLGSEEEHMEDRFELPDPADRDLATNLSDALGTGAAEPGAGEEFGADSSAANGSSIAFLLEYPKNKPDVRFLLGADASPSVLERSLDALQEQRGDTLSATGFKLPHHGSVANITPALLGKLRCKHYLVSTSGALFRHPHARAIELVLETHRGRGKPWLHFNYLTQTTRFWSDLADQEKRGYAAFHPKGISLEL